MWDGNFRFWIFDLGFSYFCCIEERNNFRKSEKLKRCWNKQLLSWAGWENFVGLFSDVISIGLVGKCRKENRLKAKTFVQMLYSLALRDDIFCYNYCFGALSDVHGSPRHLLVARWMALKLLFWVSYPISLYRADCLYCSKSCRNCIFDGNLT